MIKLGIIGAGKWGERHVRVLSQLPVKIIGIADVNEGKKALADEFETKFFRGYQQLLPLVDAVSVVVPTNLHYQVVRDALLAGKHVLVEKPATDDAGKTKELIELARKKARLLSVGYVYRFNPAVRRLKELISQIGPLQYLTARYIHSTNPPRRDSGAITNLGIHMVDILNFVLAERPSRVHCKRVNHIHPEREDSAEIMLDYGSFFASVEVSCCHPEKKRDMWVIAAREKVYADFLDQRLVRFPLLVSEEAVVAGPKIDEKIHEAEPLREELRYFVGLAESCNGNGFSSIVNIGKEDLYTTKICELALKSAQLKRDLDLPYSKADVDSA